MRCAAIIQRERLENPRIAPKTDQSSCPDSAVIGNAHFRVAWFHSPIRFVRTSSLKERWVRVSPYIGRVLRTFALTLGLAALMLQALAPLCLAGTASAGSGQSIVICTVHGMQTIQLDADGNAVP